MPLRRGTQQPYRRRKPLHRASAAGCGHFPAGLYRTLIEHLPDTITYIHPADPASSLFYISPQIEALLGCSPGEFTRKADLYAHIHPEDRERVEGQYEAHMRSGAAFDEEYRLTGCEARTVWVRDQAAMLCDEAGRPLFSHGILTDISQGKQAEAGLARQVEQLNALHMVSQEMAIAQDIERVYRAAHEAAARFVPLEAFNICLIDEPRREAEDVYLVDEGERLPGKRRPVSERLLLTRLLESGGPVLFDDYLCSPPAGSSTPPPCTTRSILAVPLMLNGRITGMLSAQHYTPGMYTPEHVQALMILANQVAVVIEHARLVQSYRLRVAALNAAANTVILTDRQGNIEWANPALTRLTGYTLEEVRGRNLGMLLTTGRPEDTLDPGLWPTLLVGQAWRGQVINRKKDGDLYTEEMTITPVPDDQGGISHFIAIKQDISERRQAEEALRESEEKYRTVVEQGGDGIAITQGGVIRFANRRLARMRGQEIDELPGCSLREFVAEADREWLDGHLRRLPGEEAPTTFDAVFLHTQSAPIEVDITAAPIHYMGEPAELVILRDVSERKRADLVYERRLKEMAALNDVSAAGIQATDVDELIRSVTRTIRGSLGPDNCGVMLFDEEAAAWTPHPSYEGMLEGEAGVAKPLSRGIVGKCLRTGLVLRVDDCTQDPDFEIIVPGIRSQVCAPLKVNGRLFGTLNVESREPGAFSAHDERLMTALAGSLSIAIEKIQLLHQEQRRRAEAAAITEVGRDISASLELDIVLERIAVYARDLLETEISAVYIAEGESSTLRAVAAIGVDSEAIKNDPVQVGQGILGSIARQRSGEIINFVEGDPRSILVQGTETVVDEHIMAVPVLNKAGLIALIAVWRMGHGSEFRPTELEFLNGLAQQVAVAIENARLFERTRQRLAEIQAVHTVSRALRSAQTLEQALPIILDQLMQILQAGGASLEMLDPHTGEIVTGLAHGEWAAVTGMRSAPGSGVSGLVLASGRPYVTSDVRADGQALNLDLFGSLQAVACVPVIDQQHPIGTLWAGRQAPFTPEEISLLSAIGEMVGSALHRMRLNEQILQRAEQLGSLRTIDQAISASLDLRLTLSILLEQVVSHLEVDAADLLLVNRTTRKLQPSASRGFRTSDLARFHEQLGGGLAPRVAREKRLLQIPNLAEYSDQIRGYLLVRDEEFTAYIGIPLMVKEQLVGVLECFHRSPKQVDADWLSFFEALAGQAAIAIEKARLIEDLQSSNQELTLAYDTTLEGWARALELRDKETEGHSRRVTDLTVELAQKMGVPVPELLHLRRGVLLHDIGKMGVADHILRKTGPLEEAEWLEMRRHPQYAYDLIYPIAYLRPALDIPYCHHERWDGTGYPRGLHGGQIPLAARIFAVVDVWDALLHDRPYRPAWTLERTLAHLRAESGKHFDPAVVAAFLEMVEG